MNQKEMEEWEGMRTSVMILEEGGGWIEDTESAMRLARIAFVMKEGAQLGGGQDHEGEDADGGAERDRADGDGGAQDGDTREGEALDEGAQVQVDQGEQEVHVQVQDEEKVQGEAQDDNQVLQTGRDREGG